MLGGKVANEDLKKFLNEILKTATPDTIDSFNKLADEMEELGKMFEKMLKIDDASSEKDN